MKQSELLTVIEDILEVDAGSISLTNSLDDLGWDSLSSISFIAEIDQRTGAQVEAKERLPVGACSSSVVREASAWPPRSRRVSVEHT